MRTVVAAVAIAALLAPACSGARPLMAASGLTGLVLRGPTQPVCVVDEPCEEPARVTLVFSRAGRAASRVRTTATGRFRIALAPGSYRVRTTESAFGRTPTPSRVTVPSGRYGRVTLRIDTGIR
jgi:hypothetical protein